MLILSVVSLNLNISCQKELRKRGLQLETIEWGKPSNLTTSLQNTAATNLAERGLDKPMKWAYLLRRFTTTRIMSISCDLGSPVMKSIERSSHILFGMCRGCSRPAGD